MDRVEKKMSRVVSDECVVYVRRVPKEVKDGLENIRRARGMSLNAIMLELMRKAVNKVVK